MKRRDFLIASVGTLGASAAVTCRADSAPCPAPNVSLAAAPGVNKSMATPCEIAGSPAPKWLRGIPPFQWVALPSLGNSSVIPNPPAPGMTGVRSVTDAWGGAALRQNGSYYILHGGGHGDYAGNEIYALQLSLDAPQWTRIWGPTPNNAIVPNQYYYDDSPSSPASIHTYNSLVFNDQDDVFMRFMRGQYIGAHFIGGVDGIRWGGTAWEQNQTNNIWPAPPNPWKFVNGQCKDSDGNVYFVNGWNRLIWNRRTNLWSVPIRNSQYAVQSCGCCYDTKRHIIWSFGGGISGGGRVGASQAYMWEITTGSERLITLTGPNASAIDGNNANSSSAIYDAVADLVLVVTGDGEIYSFNPTTFAVTRVPTSGPSLPNTTSSSGSGPWGKLQYASQLGGIVIQPTWKAATFFMRTH